MPTYEYKCDNCNHTFETLQSIKAEPLTKCPKCGKNKLRKLISGGTGLIFKGSGFYLTDYKKKSSETFKTTRPSKKSGDTGTKVIDTTNSSSDIKEVKPKSKEKK
jgi:putative FmdB family regulatory protein